MLTVQAAPPIENAELNMPFWAFVIVPSGSLQAGICTTESRGMLTIVALLRSAARCTRRVVSDRAPGSAAAPPYSSPVPSDRSRVSLPITRMLTAS